MAGTELHPTTYQQVLLQFIFCHQVAEYELSLFRLSTHCASCCIHRNTGLFEQVFQLSQIVSLHLSVTVNS